MRNRLKKTDSDFYPKAACSYRCAACRRLPDPKITVTPSRCLGSRGRVLIVGLLGLHALGVAAGIGLVLFFVGAVVVHVRTRVLYNIAFPGAFLLLAVASLVLAVVV